MKSRTFWVGLIVGIILTFVIGLAVAVSGLINMGADQNPGPLDLMGELMMDAGARWRAPDQSIPTDADPDAGLEHYAASCVVCHGAPGVDRAPWAHGLLPDPPDLAHEADEHPDEPGEFFYFIKHGIRMTAMPAFGQDHTDQEIWDIVAFLYQMPNLTPDQTQLLRQAAATTQHKHGEHDQPDEPESPAPDEPNDHTDHAESETESAEHDHNHE